MSRDTFYDKEPAKYFQGEDRPVISKKAVHLVTYPNFLSSNEDHSQDRPFTNCSPKGNKKTFAKNQFYSEKGYVPPYCDYKLDSKRINVKEGHHILSTVNPLLFDPLDKTPAFRAEITRTAVRNRSSLNGANAQPTNPESYRASKRVHSGKYTDSTSMRLTLSHIS